MKKEISYYYDYDLFLEKLDELYPQSFSVNTSNLCDFSCLNRDNLCKLIDVLKKTMTNIKVEKKEIVENPYEKLENFSDEVIEVFDDLFSNPDLMIFGHGGEVDKIMNSEFRCRYANLDSHFVPLVHTNESLENLFDWPHLGCKKIMIMALNRREFNPIYGVREKTSDYDTDIYNIPLEYFVGYFDAEKNIFVKNPFFKTKHEYNSDLKEYIVDNKRYFSNDEKYVKEFLDALSTIRFLLVYSKIYSLDLNGIKMVESQLLELIEKAYMYQEKLTPEYLDSLKQENIVKNNQEDEFTFDWDSSDWEIDEKIK